VEAIDLQKLTSNVKVSLVRNEVTTL
jgi:hypothetical protein